MTLRIELYIFLLIGEQGDISSMWLWKEVIDWV